MASTETGQVQQRLLSTGTISRSWGVTRERVRQILAELASRGELPEGTIRTPGRHYRVPAEWVRMFHAEQKEKNAKQ